MLDMPRGGAGAAANQVALNAASRTSAGNSVSVGAVNVHQVAQNNKGSDVAAAIRRTNRALNLDVGLA